MMSHGFDDGPRLQTLSKLTSNVDLDNKAHMIHAYLQEKDDGGVVLQAIDDTQPSPSLGGLTASNRRQSDKDIAITTMSETGYKLVSNQNHDSPLQRLGYEGSFTPITLREDPFDPTISLTEKETQ